MKAHRVRLMAGAALLLMAVAGAVAWVLVSGGGEPPALSAAEVVEKVCSITDYDGQFDISQDEETVTWDFRVSVPDSHAHIVLRDNRGTSLAKAEMIVKDGVGYGRWSATSEDGVTVLDVDTFTEWSIEEHPSFSPLSCLDEANAEALDAVPRGLSPRGVSGLRHLVEERRNPGGYALKREYWVNAEGNPLEMRMTQSSPTDDVVTDYTLSGWGEPNVITAPILPTRTSTPTSTP